MFAHANNNLPEISRRRAARSCAGVTRAGQLSDATVPERNSDLVTQEAYAPVGGERAATGSAPYSSEEVAVLGIRTRLSVSPSPAHLRDTGCVVVVQTATAVRFHGIGVAGFQPCPVDAAHAVGPGQVGDRGQERLVLTVVVIRQVVGARCHGRAELVDDRPPRVGADAGVEVGLPLRLLGVVVPGAVVVQRQEGAGQRGRRPYSRDMVVVARATDDDRSRGTSGNLDSQDEQMDTHWFNE